MAFLFPTFFYKSAYSIPYGDLFKAGKRCVLFDIDNTLVCHGMPADERALELMKSLKSMGFKIGFVSNNVEQRVKSFNEQIGGEYVFKADKPAKRGYLELCERMKMSTAMTVFVGDQIFTDIIGANRAGIESFLVQRIGRKEEIQIHLKRILEAPIILAFSIFKSGKCYLK